MDEIEIIWKAFLKRYRKLAMEYAPDKQPKENKEKAHEFMVWLNGLYEETYAAYQEAKNE